MSRDCREELSTGVIYWVFPFTIFPAARSALRREPTISFPSWYTINMGNMIHSLRFLFSVIITRGLYHTHPFGTIQYQNKVWASLCPVEHQSQKYSCER